MTAAPPVQPAADPALACVRCGYSLTGLAESGACPECAVPIAASHRAVTCAFASPARLRATRRATTAFAIAITLGLAGTVLRYTQWFPGPLLSLAYTNPWLYGAMVTLLIAAVHCLALWGWWTLARKDPTVPPSARAPWAHRALCWTVPISLLLVLLSATASFLFVSRGAVVAQSLTTLWFVCAGVGQILRALQLWIGAALLYGIRRAWAARPAVPVGRVGPAGFWIHLVLGAAFLLVTVDTVQRTSLYIQVIQTVGGVVSTSNAAFIAAARNAADLITPPLFLLILFLARSALSAALRDLRTQLAPASTPAGSTP